MRFHSPIIFGFLVISFFCKPVSAQETRLQSMPILQTIEEFSVLIHKPHIDFLHLQKSLDTLYSSLEKLDPATINIADISRSTNQIIRASTLFRDELIQKIPDWKAKNVWSDKSETTVRNITRALRYLEDSIGEHSLGMGDSKQKPLGLRAFTGGEPFVISQDGSFFNPDKSFRAGDVILMRGSSEVSAAIARIGVVNSQFSHVAMVTKDPKTGVLYLAESIIEKGVTISPLEDFISKGIARAVVYRNSDSDLAAKASEKAWELTHDGNQHLYDFTMDTSDEAMLLKADSPFFCSKLIKYAFQSVDPSFKMPMFETKINPINRDFLRSIGVADTKTTVFAPSDMELDTRFQAVAEFRDFSKTSTARLYDTIMDKVYEWLDEGGSFKKNRMLEIISRVGHNLSKIGFLKKLAWKMGLPIAPHVGPKVLEAVIALRLIRGPLLKELQPIIDIYVSKYGVVPPPRIISSWLDDIRLRNTNKAFKYIAIGPTKSTAISCLRFY